MPDKHTIQQLPPFIVNITLQDFNAITNKSNVSIRCSSCNAIFQRTKLNCTHRIRKKCNVYNCKDCIKKLAISGSIVECLQCGKRIYRCIGHIKKQLNHFCSHTCSAIYGNTGNFRLYSKATLKKICKALRSKEKPVTLRKSNVKRLTYRQKNKATKTKEIVCPVCKLSFVSIRQKNYYFPKVCSDECRDKQRISNMFGTNFVYNGIHMQSSWELKVAQFLDEKGIIWTRPKGIKYIAIDGKQRTYYSDFYLPKFNLYIDPKNPIVIQMQYEKLKIVSRQINLIYGNVVYIKDYVNRSLNLLPSTTQPTGRKLG